MALDGETEVHSLKNHVICNTHTLNNILQSLHSAVGVCLRLDGRPWFESRLLIRICRYTHNHYIIITVTTSIRFLITISVISNPRSFSDFSSVNKLSGLTNIVALLRVHAFTSISPFPINKISINFYLQLIISHER